MVHAGIRGLDTPQTNLGDATYISGRHSEFDLSDEQSFRAPLSVNNILDLKLQNARHGRSNKNRTSSIRPALSDRMNLPGLGGGEFTPLLKNATRNSALRNELRTPAFLKKRGLNSVHGNSSPLPTSNMTESASRNYDYIISTPATEFNASSNVSTPTIPKPPKSAKSHVLHDGAQLSLREQEEVVDKVEKENFALKLKICFLEDALHKAGPEYNEAAIKENTELKVDKITLQKELARFRKTLHAAERDVELYRKYESSLKDFNELLDKKDLLEIENNKLGKESSILQRDLEIFRRKINELEENLEHERSLFIQNEQDLKNRHQSELNALNDKIDSISTKYESGRKDFNELLNKNDILKIEKNNLEKESLTLQRDLEKSRRKIKELEENLEHGRSSFIQDLKDRHQVELNTLNDKIDSISTKYESSRKEFHELLDKKDTLEIENDKLEKESSTLQRDLEKFRRKIKELEESLEHERSLFIQNEQDLKNRHQSELNDLHDKIEDIQAQLERKERMNRSEFEKWANEKRNLQAQKDMIEEKAEGLQHSIDKLQEAEGTMSSKEAKLQQNLQIEIDRHREQDVILNQRINELNEDIFSRQQNMAELQRQLIVVKEELRLSQREQKQLEEKVEALEDEVEVLQTNLDEEIERNAQLKVNATDLDLEKHNKDWEAEKYDLERSLDQAQLAKEELQVKNSTAENTITKMREKIERFEKRVETWEAEKYDLGRSLDQAQLAKEELQVKNSTAEATITRLRGKIERLESALQSERLNAGENRTMALERMDLHDMLRESQSQAEVLDLLVKERDQSIFNLTAIENELRTQLNVLHEERSRLHKKLSSYQAQIKQVQNQFGQAKAQWELDRKNLTRRVRFANLSLSFNESNNKNNTSNNNNNDSNNEKNEKIDDNESSFAWLAKQQNSNLPPKLLKMKLEFDERERYHIKEMRGVGLQLEWLRAKCQREEKFRAEAAFAKRFMSLQIALFEACNKTDIQLLEQCGIKRPPPRPKKPISIKRVGIVLRALVRMKHCAEKWAEKRKIDEKVRGQVEKQRKLLLHDMALRSSKESSNTNLATNTMTTSNIKKKNSKGVSV